MLHEIVAAILFWQDTWTYNRPWLITSRISEFDQLHCRNFVPLNLTRQSCHLRSGVCVCVCTGVSIYLIVFSLVL